MNLELEGRSALITCASSGVGRACVGRLLAEGAHVIAVSRGCKPEDFADLQGRERLMCVQADMNDADAFEARLGEVINSSTVQPTILVFVPVREPNLPLGQIEATQVGTAMDRNFLRFMFLAQRLIPLMREAGFGRIVTLLGASTLAPLADHVLANVSRISIASVAAGLGREHAGSNICVNNILLGVFDTPGLRALWGQRASVAGVDTEVYLAHRAAGIPVRRLGRPEECANVCALLCSPVLGYLNGQTLLLDGGLNPNL